MRKDELRKLRALPATKEMMEKGKGFRTEKKKRFPWDAKESIVTIPNFDRLLRVQNLNGYVKIALFLPEDMKKDIKTPRYEIFLNVPGGEYITRELDENGKEVRWLKAMVINLAHVSHEYYDSISGKDYINKDGMDTLGRLPLKDDRGQKGLSRLQAWQQELLHEEMRQREAREQAPWDEDMSLVPELPKDFEEWMRKETANEYYIIYEYSPKQTRGYCSRCKKFVKIKNPRHDKVTKCPSCKAKAFFKASGRIKTLSTDDYKAEIIQKIEGGLVVRKFEQRQWYRNTDYTEPHIRTRECQRVLIFEDGTVKRYTWDMYKNKYLRWVYQDNDMYVYGEYGYLGSRMKLYKRNFARLKQNSMFKKSAIDLWDVLPCGVTRYLTIEKGNPAIEMLARIGMFKLAEELLHSRYDKNLMDQNATEIAKMLKIDNNRLKRLKAMNANLASLRWMQYEKLANTIWPDEMIKDLGIAGFATSAFDFLKAPISFVKCYNYLKKQAVMTGETIRQTLITWDDYHSMAEQMKMNVKLDQIAKPKDLKQAHDELVLLKSKDELKKQVKDIEKKWPKVNEQLPKLQKFAFTSGEYTIVVPKNVMDIAIEGTVLRHCVHTCEYYFSRIQTDESYLFFLRKSKSPDTPWYTLEVEPSGNIRQKRTTGDNQNADFKEAVEFLKKWQRHFKKQLTKEEKELGKKADELRKENYKNLRVNGNRVWHGKLAGQLLADVLEADFMAAM